MSAKSKSAPSAPPASATSTPCESSTSSRSKTPTPKALQAQQEREKKKRKVTPSGKDEVNGKDEVSEDSTDEEVLAAEQAARLVKTALKAKRIEVKARRLADEALEKDAADRRRKEAARNGVKTPRIHLRRTPSAEELEADRVRAEALQDADEQTCDDADPGHTSSQGVSACCLPRLLCCCLLYCAAVPRY